MSDPVLTLRKFATSEDADDRDEVSYRGQLDYTGDRYGVQLEGLVVGTDFNPEVGFLRRSDFERSFGSFRFSPRPQSIAAIRKFSWEGQFDYITDRDGVLETREVQGRFRIEFESSDNVNGTYTRSYELLKQPFPIAPGVTIPMGGYGFQDVRVSLALGQQIRAAALVPANKKKDPRYTRIYRDMPGYSGMRPRRLRPMIVGVPLEPGVAGDRSPEGGRQGVGAVARAGDREGGEHVLQLADVAGPGVGRQGGHRLVGQRRAAAGRPRRPAAVGGRHDPQVEPLGAVLAEPADLAVLEHAEQLRLGARRQLGHLRNFAEQVDARLARAQRSTARTARCRARWC